jgi:hypothetical protein
MLENELVLGGKYVPHKKTAGNEGLASSVHWVHRGGQEQGFLYYIGYNVHGHYVFSSRGYTGDGDYFHPSDVTPYEESPKRGDKILVWDHDSQLPMERLFVAYVEGASYPVMCVSGAEEASFSANQPFSITEWRQYRLIEPVLELTIEEIAKRYGVATVKIVESNTTK